jgi:hypothetical protein
MTDVRDDNGGLLFSEKELACRCCGKVVLAPLFAGHLAALRLAWARPMIVNSCCRCSRHNISVNGHERSLHVFDTPHWPTDGTCAIDIRIKDGNEALNLALCAADLGWSVGVPRGGFIHLDRRDLVRLPQALFGY